MKIQWLLVLSMTAVAAPTEAAKLKNVRTTQQQEKQEEVAFTVEGVVRYPDAGKLRSCLAGIDHPFDPKQPGEKIFANMSWGKQESEELRECRADKCEFTFPLRLRDVLIIPVTFSSRKIVYYQLMKKVALDKKKRTKRWRIEVGHVRPSAPCAQSAAFDKLLNQPRSSNDRLIWRKLPGRPRMSPTVLVMQLGNWQHGASLCLGRTLLRADHYHNDHLELTEISPAGEGLLKVSYHVRSRFGFFARSWLARRMKSVIRKKIIKGSRKLLKRWVKRCT